MKINKRLILLLLIISSLRLSAQDGSPSPYSYFGLGDTSFSGNAENMSMGGLSVYTDSLHYNINNPASLSRLKLINLTLGMNNRFIKMQDNSGSNWFSSHYLNYFALGIPIGKKAGVGFGLLPETTSEYSVYSKNDIGINTSKSSGGMSRLFLAGSYKIIKGLSLGLEYQYHFGYLQHEYIWAPNNVLTYTKENNSVDVSGSTFKLSADYIYQLPKQKYFKTHVNHQLSTNLNASSIGYLRLIKLHSTGSEEIVSNTDKPNKKGKILLPSISEFGLGYGKKNKYFIGLDFSYVQMKDFKNKFYDPSFITYKDAYAVKFGGMYQPEYNSITSYLKRVSYRAGFYYKNTGLNLYGTDIKDFGITFGLGLPSLKSFSNLNLGFEIGQRGIQTQKLVKENYFNVHLSFSLNDLWFIKRKIN